MSRISLRYFAGYSLLFLSRLLEKGLEEMWRVVSIPQQFALIIWTPREIERHARADWNSWPSVLRYSDTGDWLNGTEQALVESHFSKNGALLNLACGGGREALLLAKRGLRVTACDWSPRMVTEAQRRAREANLPVRFAVADLMDDLPFPEKTFDYLLLTNRTYSCLFPRRRRIRFLRQAHSVLKPGGVFIISFAPASGNPRIPARPLEWLFMRLRQWPPFNREYEPGDRIAGSGLIHYFRSEELVQELQEAKFLIKELLWDRGYAVLVKL
jgi:SAM-dependent methyltransferase